MGVPYPNKLSYRELQLYLGECRSCQGLAVILVPRTCSPRDTHWQELTEGKRVLTYGWLPFCWAYKYVALY